MHPTAEFLDSLVCALLTSSWPTTEADHREWAESLGLPVDGERRELRFDVPATEHLWSAFHSWSIVWTYHRDAFVGLQWFVAGDSDDLETVADDLRAAWGPRWSLDIRDSRLGGYSAVGRIGDKGLEVYWSEARIPFPGAPELPAVIQIAVDDAERATGLQAEARALDREGKLGLHLPGAGMNASGPDASMTLASDLRTRLNAWDPIGVRPGVCAPADEYDCLRAGLLRLPETQRSERDVRRLLETELRDHFGLSERLVTAEVVAGLTDLIQLPRP